MGSKSKARFQPVLSRNSESTIEGRVQRVDFWVPEPDKRTSGVPQLSNIMTFLRRIVFVACLAVFFAGPGRSLFADDKDKKEPAQKEPVWVVKIEVLMVAMPQEKFIDLLPDLQDEAKIEKVIPAL